MAKHKTIYTAFSKRNFYARKFISAYVLNAGATPLNPFMNWGYFLDDLVDREKIYNANKRLIELSDELWQFGAISDGCHQEIILAKDLGMNVRFFTIGKSEKEIKEIKDLADLEFEKAPDNKLTGETDPWYFVKHSFGKAKDEKFERDQSKLSELPEREDF